MSQRDFINGKLRQMRCPICWGGPLRLRLRCDLGSPCVLIAICDRCVHEFSAQVADGLDAIEKKYHELVTGLGCPQCGGKHIDLSFQCDVLSRACSCLVRCTDCLGRVILL